MNILWDKLKQNKILVAVIVLAIMGVLLYANTLRNQMFWDDNDFILNNAYVHDWHYLPQYFSQNIIAGSSLLSNYWRPVLLIVFSIEYHLWGSHVLGYHLLNILFHISNAILLFYLLQSLFKKYSLSILTALLFLIHPLQTEAVTYVNSLGDSLSVFFILLGLNNYQFFRETDSSSSFWSSLICFPLALMSKETAIIYPGLVVLVEFFGQEQVLFKQRIKKVLYYVWPYLVIAGIYILLRATVLNFQNTFNLYNEQNVFTSHLSVRIFTFFRILTTYFGLLFYPHDLHMERSLPIATSFMDSGVWIGAILFNALVIAAVWLWKRQSAISFGILWFLIGLAPTSNIVVPINGLLYEHWLYLPMIGFWLALFGALYSSSAVRSLFFSSRFVRTILFLFLISYILFLSCVAIKRNSDWRDPVTLYTQTLKYSPNSYRVINNLGMAYADRGDFVKAVESYQHAISLSPDVQVGYHNLANAYKELGQPDQAIENFQIAIAKDPNFFYSYNALTQLYLEQKNYLKARAIQEQYLPYSPTPLNTLMLLVQIAQQEQNKTAENEYLRKINDIKSLTP